MQKTLSCLRSKYLLFAAILLCCQFVHAQAPNITYTASASYPEGKAITISPVNTGGAVPSTYYGSTVTVAGTGTGGKVNGSTATQSTFNRPMGVALDGRGNFFIADYGNNLIRELIGGGTTITFAGTGTAGSANGTGTAASFNKPTGIVCDDQQNVYVTDAGNNLVRKITPAGVVTTFAGSGAYGSANGQGASASFSAPAGIAIDNSNNLYISDYGSRKIRKITPNGLVTTLAGSGALGYADGTGVAATFGDLEGITVDFSGNVYVTDVYYSLVRKITPAGVVTTLAGNPFNSGTQDGIGSNAYFSDPYGIAVDANGIIYVCDAASGMIRRVSQQGLVTSIVGGFTEGKSVNGLPGVATFNEPVSLASDGIASVYVVDEGDNMIKQVNLLGYSIGLGQRLPPGLSFSASGVISGTPTSVLTDTSAYTISGFNYNGGSTTTVKFNIVNSITTSPNIYTIAGKYNDYINAGDGGPASAATLDDNYGMTMDNAGNIYIANFENTIRKIDAKTHKISTMAGTGVQGFSGDNGNALQAEFNFQFSPALLADSLGNLYVADNGNHCIRKIDANNIITTIAGTPTKQGYLGDNGPAKSAHLNYPGGMAIDAANNLYFADESNLVVRKIDSKTQVITTVAGNGKSGYSGDNGPATSAPIDYAERIALDKSGNLYISEENVGIVRRVDASTHMISTYAGTPVMDSQGVFSPERLYSGDGGKANAAVFGGLMGLAFDAAGNLYVADEYNSVIRKIDASSNIISTYAGVGIATYSGDGGKATLAGMNDETDLSFDKSGKLFICDSGNGLIRKIGGTSANDYGLAGPLLATLHLSAGTLSPAFAAGTTAYTENVTNAVSSITVTAKTTDANATMKINGVTVASGTASPAIALNPGANTINVVVIAADKVTTTTYSITVTRAAAGNAALATLHLSAGTLTPAFAATTTGYTENVTYAVSSITVTAKTADANATMKINGTTVASGAVSQAIALKTGANTINVAVTAPDGITNKNYSIVVTRAASNNAALAALHLSAGTLSPAFTATTANYTESVTTAVSSITVTAKTADANATMKINGTTVVSGTASQSIALNPGANTITVAVLAQDAVTTETYKIVVTKPRPVDATLLTLHLSAGTLSPAFATATTSYSESVTNAVSSITVTAKTTDANATMKVNGTTVASGAASQSIALNVGANTISVVVTAADGVTTNTYTVVVTRAAGSKNAVMPADFAESTQTANDSIKVHQAVSPNGDGIDDYLQIDNIAQYPDNHLGIITNNGQLIYDVEGYDNRVRAFDGHNNKTGLLLLPGTYFYMLDYTVNGSRKRKTGYLVLKY